MADEKCYEPRKNPCGCGFGVYFNNHTGHNHCPACGAGEFDERNIAKPKAPPESQGALFDAGKERTGYER